MAGGGASIALRSVRVNKRLLFASLTVAAAIVVAVAVGTATRNTGDDDTSDGTDDVTLTSSGDLSPTIGTNAAVTGRSIPTLDLRTANGDAFSTAELVGRPLVINVWYSTCPPCKRELPAFAAAHTMFGDDVRFVGVNSSGFDAKSEDEFARDRGVQYELLYDPDGNFTTSMGITTAPQTLFVDASGAIVQQTGELTADRLEELIRTNLL